MSNPDYASQYFQGTAVGASAMGQVVALYDTILRDLRRAMEATASKQIEKRINAANHAIIVIGELQGVLDFERGGEVASTLSSFYSVSRAMIAQAATHGSLQKFEEAISMFARVRAAWSHVERTVAASEPTSQLRVSSLAPAIVPPSVSDPSSDKPKDSAPSRWSA
jgi:flagellar secretion chaperone FliS